MNTAGSFICLCSTGFIRSYDESDCEGTYCTMTMSPSVLCEYYYDNADVDECANDTLNNCFASNHQVCRNVPGSFDCDCEPGYEADSIDDIIICQGQLII